MYPKVGYRIRNFPVERGDTISAEVQYVANNRFRLTIANISQNVSFTTTQHSKAKRQSAEWIVEAPYSRGTLPLADFGTIPFTGCTATLSGHTGPIADITWQHDAIDMSESDGTLKAETSGLSGGGAGFSVTWHHE